jgi:hypothetical protein
MQTQNSQISQPLYWDSNGATWDNIPVLAHPMRHGWALWQAIQERVVYLAEDRGITVPDALLGIMLPFNPNSDYKHTELLMHNTLQWLLLQSRDFHSPSWPEFTIDTALEAIGDSILHTPCHYYLSAEWLLQAYKFVNAIKAYKHTIPITIATSDYVGQDDTYSIDKIMYQKYIYYAPYAMIIHVVGTNEENTIYGTDGLPSNVRYTAVNGVKNASGYLSAPGAVKVDEMVDLMKLFISDSIASSGLPYDMLRVVHPVWWYSQAAILRVGEWISEDYPGVMFTPYEQNRYLYYWIMVGWLEEVLLSNEFMFNTYPTIPS